MTKRSDFVIWVLFSVVNSGLGIRMIQGLSWIQGKRWVACTGALWEEREKLWSLSWIEARILGNHDAICAFILGILPVVARLREVRRRGKSREEAKEGHFGKRMRAITRLFFYAVG
ncbi:uncharacterized protein A4U43_C10F17000 [Asparagus officinalis]|uniref:Uncharacterized protein n=1 Tax=Asparagus officinalis TaxID=4686 RepID=A0A5P1E3N5_ASPOF|nr:uncharacterized protein A4U43_C10F17000 [Asparagus officinalis]